MCNVGVILAGGKGTRMGNLSKVANKCLLPLGSDPMIHHSIKKMVDFGISDIMIITNDGQFMDALGSGETFKCNLSYRYQDNSLGIPHALYMAKRFCRGDSCIVLLGDNVFQDGLMSVFYNINKDNTGLVLKSVLDPQRYGIAEFKDGKIVGIVEKPTNPLSDLAVTGIYHYPNDVFNMLETLKPSARGEYEITDVNNIYISQGRVQHERLNGFWIDAGTIESYHQANHWISEATTVTQDAAS